MRRPESIGRELLAHRHTSLLVTLVALFAVRPMFGDTGPGAIVFSLSTLFVALAALVIVQVEDMVGERDVLRAQRRRRLLIGCVLAVPAVCERVWIFYHPSSAVILAGAFSWLLFFCFVTWSQVRNLRQQRYVTSETISMAISIYLLLGLCWTLLYLMIFTLDPGSFNLQLAPGANEAHVFPMFLYFSLTCLSTIGFGDIDPLTLPSRYAAVAEGIAGQFYLAILVARLVGMQMAGSSMPPVSSPENERPKN